jgi:hypothetical protein
MHPLIHMVVSFSFLLDACPFCPHQHLICIHSRLSFVLIALTHTRYAPIHAHDSILLFLLVVCSFCPHLHLICTHSYTWWSPFISGTIPSAGRDKRPRQKVKSKRYLGLMDYSLTMYVYGWVHLKCKKNKRPAKRKGDHHVCEWVHIKCG